MNARSLPAYRAWVASRAPFTTYFTPGDCFARPEEIEAYTANSRSAVACLEGTCVVNLEPRCTR